MKEEKKKQAALMKALETPEEKRARRLAKKEAKERKKREKMGWGEEYMGYTNTDNPFGDNNLLGTFIWSKVSAQSTPLSQEAALHVGSQEIVFLWLLGGVHRAVGCQEGLCLRWESLKHYKEPHESSAVI